MILPKIKLKNQLALVNAISKVIIVVFLALTIPWLVSKISINDTDEILIGKLDEVFVMIDSLGIEAFFDENDEFSAFGSYNILKEEYISIEHLKHDTLINSIAFSQRNIEDEIVDYRVLSYSFDTNGEFYLIEIDILNGDNILKPNFSNIYLMYRQGKCSIFPATPQSSGGIVPSLKEFFPIRTKSD